MTPPFKLPEPVAFMAGDQMRAITQMELETIPSAEGRRARCKARYRIDLFTADQMQAAIEEAVRQDAMNARRGFMCAVDFQHHLGEDTEPAPVYADEETLREQRKCVDECGIVEVEVRIARWVQDQNFDADRTLPPPVNAGEKA